MNITRVPLNGELVNIHVEGCQTWADVLAEGFVDATVTNAAGVSEERWFYVDYVEETNEVTFMQAEWDGDELVLV